MRELSELLADSVDARARSVAGLTPDADDLNTIVRTVRRKRVVRRSLQTLAVIPIAGGLAVGGYLGLGALQSTQLDPAATPTVTSPAPAADPEPGALELGTLFSDEAGLPPHHRAPENLADHVGAGWTALIYKPVAAGDVSGVATEPTAHTILLATPESDLVRTADLDRALDVQLVHWDATSPKARVTWTGGSQVITVGWVDLLTGELEADGEQFENWAVFLGHSAAGAELWVEDPGAGETEATVWSIGPDGSRREIVSLSSQGAPRVDPSGRSLLTESSDPAGGFAVVDIESGELREVPFGTTGQTCAVVGWLDAVNVATLCHDPVSEEAAAALDRVDFVAQDAALYAVETVAGGEARLLHRFAEGQPVPEPWTGVRTENGVLAFVASTGFPQGCSAGVGTWDGVEPRTVLGAGEHGSNLFSIRPGGPSSVLVTSSQSCESSGVQSEVHSIDVTTGAAQLLTPWLESAPGDGVDYWHQSVVTAVVGR